MDPRYSTIAAIAASTHGVISRQQLRHALVADEQTRRWVRTGLLVRLGPRSYGIARCATVVAAVDVRGRSRSR